MKEFDMAFENAKAEIALLIQQMVNNPKDAAEAEAQLREYIRTLQAQGLPIPDDIKKLEKQLAKDFDV